MRCPPRQAHGTTQWHSQQQTQIQGLNLTERSESTQLIEASTKGGTKPKWRTSTRSTSTRFASLSKSSPPRLALLQRQRCVLLTLLEAPHDRRQTMAGGILGVLIGTMSDLHALKVCWGTFVIQHLEIDCAALPSSFLASVSTLKLCFQPSYLRMKCQVYS